MRLLPDSAEQLLSALRATERHEKKLADQAAEHEKKLAEEAAKHEADRRGWVPEPKHVFPDEIGDVVARVQFPNDDGKRNAASVLHQRDALLAIRSGELQVVHSLTRRPVPPAEVSLRCSEHQVSKASINRWLSSADVGYKLPEEKSDLADVSASQPAPAREKASAWRCDVILKTMRDKYGDPKNLPFYLNGSHAGDPALKAAQAALVGVSTTEVRTLFQEMHAAGDLGPRRRALPRGDPRLPADPAP